MPKDDRDTDDQATDVSRSFDLEAVKKAESEAAREARRQYEADPPLSSDIKSIILAHLEAMDTPTPDRVDLMKDPVMRSYLIAELDDPGSLTNKGPMRGDTLWGIIDAVQDRLPGTPETRIRRTLELLDEDGEVYHDKTASEWLGDKVWRRSPAALTEGDALKRIANTGVREPQRAGHVVTPTDVADSQIDGQRDETALNPRRLEPTDPEPALDAQGRAITPVKPITMRVAIQEFQVSRTTLQRAARAGNLKSFRSDNAAQNAEHIFDEEEVSRRYERR